MKVCIRLGKGKKLQALDRDCLVPLPRTWNNCASLLRQNKVKRVVMESTGVYWMPVRNVLERGDWKFDLVLVNPQHVRALQGEKTDDKDCRASGRVGSA